MGIYDWIYILTQPFATYIIYKFMHIFFDERQTTAKTEFMSYVIYMIFITGVYLLINIPIVMLVCNLICFCLLTLNYQAPLLKKFMATLLIYISLMFIEIILARFISGYFEFETFSTNNYSSILGLVTIKLLSFMLVLILKNFKNMKEGIEISAFNWISIILIPGVSIFITILLLQAKNINNFYVFLSIILLFVINFITFYLYDNIAATFQIKIEQMQLIEQNKSYERQFSVMKEALENTNVIRHDFKHHLAVIHCFVELNQTEECLSYLNKLSEWTDKQSLYAKSGHPIIDSIINFKLDQAAAKKISVSVRLQIPKDLELSTFDLSTLLGNLLDNAIEATCKLPEKRMIQLTIQYQKGILLIQLKNSFNGIIRKSDNKILTTKKDAKQHGIGLRRISEVVEKYNGYLVMENDDHIFLTKIMLYLPNENQEKPEYDNLPTHF